MEDFVLVIFGITGNLSQIKLIPVLYDMAQKGILPEGIQIVGSARSPLTKEQFQKFFYQTLSSENRHHQHQIKLSVFRSLCQKLHYLNGNLDDPLFYQKLKKYLHDLSPQKSPNLIFYLATYPNLYQHIFQNLKAVGLNEEKGNFIRLMIEKPIGDNLSSAQNLNNLLLKYFREEQIFRLDHYLGKETLQNILTFRFGNGLFEPLLNSNYIDHLQITAAEDFGIGKRGGYYDNMGALKDVGQNHLLQMLAFATMDAPREFSNQAVTQERLKIIHGLTCLPDHLILGQYLGYQEELNIPQGSLTDTFFAFKTEIKSERFLGVPIYIRGGKRLKQTVTEIAVVFKNPENRLFKHLDCGEEPNILLYRISPNEGIVLQILTKIPGHDFKLQPSFMQFCYPQKKDSHALPDPYEKLLVDAIRGDQTFFNDAEEVEAEWQFIDQLLTKKQPVHFYQPGSWGPKEADELIQKDGRTWLTPSPNFCNF